MRRRKSPADQFWSTHRDHLPTNLYNNIAFLKYVWQDPLTSWFICKVVPAGGGGEGRGGEGRERGGEGRGGEGRGGEGRERGGEGRGGEGEGRERGGGGEGRERGGEGRERGGEGRGRRGRGEGEGRGGRGEQDVHCMFNMERVWSVLTRQVQGDPSQPTPSSLELQSQYLRWSAPP